jgi:uncharacterized OsmC-like protein
MEYVHDREAHCVPVMKVSVRMPADFPEARREALLKVAMSCTVHNTLCSVPQIEIAVASKE